VASSVRKCFAKKTALRKQASLNGEEGNMVFNLGKKGERYQVSDELDHRKGFAREDADSSPEMTRLSLGYGLAGSGDEGRVYALGASTERENLKETPLGVKLGEGKKRWEPSTRRKRGQD